MSVDLTQHQIDQLFKGQEQLTEAVRELHKCVDEEMRPALKVVATVTEAMRNQLSNGLDSRVRRIEILAAVGAALMGVDKVPGAVNLVLNLLR